MTLFINHSSCKPYLHGNHSTAIDITCGRTHNKRAKDLRKGVCPKTCHFFKLVEGLNIEKTLSGDSVGKLIRDQAFVLLSIDGANSAGNLFATYWQRIFHRNIVICDGIPIVNCKFPWLIFVFLVNTTSTCLQFIFSGKFSSSLMIYPFNTELNTNYKTHVEFI